jgi:hypothetical protein
MPGASVLRLVQPPCWCTYRPDSIEYRDGVQTGRGQKALV